MIYLMIVLTILAVCLTNYMFFRRGKRKMRQEERRNEKQERLMEMLKKNKTGNHNPEGVTYHDHESRF